MNERDFDYEAAWHHLNGWLTGSAENASIDEDELVRGYLASVKHGLDCAR